MSAMRALRPTPDVTAWMDAPIGLFGGFGVVTDALGRLAAGNAVSGRGVALPAFAGSSCQGYWCQGKGIKRIISGLLRQRLCQLLRKD